MDIGHNDDEMSEKRRNADILSAAADIVANDWGIFARFGHFAAKFGAALLLGIILSLKLIFSELLDIGVSLIKTAVWLLKELTAPMRSRFDLNKKLQRQVRKAKKEDKKSTTRLCLTSGAPTSSAKTEFSIQLSIIFCL